MIGYKIRLEGILLSVAHKEAKTYDTKVTPAHTILNFVDVDEEGNMKPIKVKYYEEHKFKKGDKVSLDIQMSAMDSSIFFKGFNMIKL